MKREIILNITIGDCEFLITASGSDDYKKVKTKPYTDSAHFWVDNGVVEYINLPSGIFENYWEGETINDIKLLIREILDYDII